MRSLTFAGTMIVVAALAHIAACSSSDVTGTPVEAKGGSGGSSGGGAGQDAGGTGGGQADVCSDYCKKCGQGLSSCMNQCKTSEATCTPQFDSLMFCLVYGGCNINSCSLQSQKLNECMAGGKGGTAGTGQGGTGQGGTGQGGTGQGGTGQGGTGQGGTGQGGTGGTAVTPKLGAKCVTSGDCGAGLTCLLPSDNGFLGGGPAGGLCTADCTQDNTVCDGLDPNAVCLDVTLSLNDPPQAWCVQGCTQGPPMQSGDWGNFDANKCRGRHDMACVDLDGNISVCLPTCQKDSECGTKKCDPEWTVCKSSPHQGLPFGSDCRDFALSEGDAGATCAGTCLAVGKGTDAGSTDPLNIAYFCSQKCVYGDSTGCGFEDTPANGMCIFAYNTSGNGDMGYCGKLCDSDSECLDAANNAFCDTQYAASLGRGLCSWLYGSPADAGGGAGAGGGG